MKIINKINVLLPLFLGFFFCYQADALDIQVAGPNDEAVTEFRWLIEEDATYHVEPGVPDPKTLAVIFHRSYMPVVLKGDHTNSTGIVLDPAKHYFVSILPDSGYTNGGAPVKPGQTAVTVHINRLPLPTAQITVFVFEDNHPINNAPDQPEELGLEGFKVIVEDGGGRYGVSAGVAMMDAFGNPLGTTYDENGNVLVMGNGVLLTGPDGKVTIKNLSPGKYGI